MAYYSDPTHQLLAKIADGIETLNKTLAEAPLKDASLLHATLAENLRLKESLQQVNEELLQIRMDATKDPALLAAIKDLILHPRKK